MLIDTTSLLSWLTVLFFHRRIKRNVRSDLATPMNQVFRAALEFAVLIILFDNNLDINSRSRDEWIDAFNALLSCQC